MASAEDLLLAYHAKLDRVSLATAREMLRDIRAGLARIDSYLSKQRGGSLALHYQALRPQLSAMAEALKAKLGATLLASTDKAVAGAVEVAGEIMLGTGAPLTAEALIAAKSAADLFDYRRWGAELGEAIVRQLDSQLRRSIALGEGPREAAERVRTVTRLSAARAERLARTALASASNRAVFEAVTAARLPTLLGWRYSAILDGRTSAVCRALHGTEWKVGDPSITPPPRHPNCRSILVPVLAGQDEPLFPDFDSWLRTKPEDEQLSILGPARFRLWKQGTPLGSMATADRPLSLNELGASR
jgi:SPP1 gp7 family putative phage head morphogenesis protein